MDTSLVSYTETPSKYYLYSQFIQDYNPVFFKEKVYFSIINQAQKLKFKIIYDENKYDKL